MTTFSEFKKSLLANAEAHGTHQDVQTCRLVLGQTARFLSDTGASAETVASLESLGSDSVPRVNAIVQTGGLSVSRLNEFVAACKVPKGFATQVAIECARILDGSVTRGSHYSNESLDQTNHMSIESYAGRGVSNMLRHDDSVSLEAFGGDIDRLQQDNRMSIVLAVLRPFTSIIDKILPRVAEEGNVVSMKIPAPEVYDLATSMNASSAVRNASSNRQPLVTLYKNPDAVSTRPQQVIAMKANDTGTVAVVYDPANLQTPVGMLNTNVTANLFDLTMNTARIGFNSTDYTDLIAEGGRVATVLVQVTSTSGGAVVTEVFPVQVQYLDQSRYVQSANNNDSGDVVAVVPFVTMLRSTSTVYNNGSQGAVSTIFQNFTDGAVQLDGNFTSTLNLKTGTIQGQGSVQPSIRARAGVTSISAATQTAYGALQFSVVGYLPELYFDEENMRKTTTAIRVNYLERQFVIPRSRNFIVDYALQQQDDTLVTSTINKVTALGNSARGLAIMESRLNDVSAALAFQAANPEMASLITPTRLSVASTLCLPYVAKMTLDYADNKTAVMRETERLSDMHARLRETLLNGLATVCAQSLYLNNLEAGETVVFKVLAYSAVADLIFGILDYHNTLNDVVRADNGCDYAFQLPNGYRIDVVKTNFTDYLNTVMVVPVREIDPTSVVSFGTTRDRGTYTATYNPINNQAVARRTVTNSREIVFPTNPLGILLTILNLSSELGTVGPA